MEVDRIRRRYTELDDAALLEHASHGPDGYATPEVWQIIASEVKQRGLEAPAPTDDLPMEGLHTAPAALDNIIDVGGPAPGVIHHVILVHADGRRIAVKRGFCWPAFFLTWIWAFARSLPGWGIGLLVLAVGTGALVSAGSDPGTVPLPGLGIGLLWRYVIGSEGNRAREQALVAQGFRAIGTVPSVTPDEALARVRRSPVSDPSSLAEAP